MEFRFTRIAGKKPIYSVSLGETVVGMVERFFVRHLQMEGWEATASDGHRGVHEHRWQAAGALVADLTKYPFPIIKRAAA